MFAINMDDLLNSDAKDSAAPAGELLEACLMDLTDVQGRYQAWINGGCPFEAGELVTPVAGRHELAGHPHIVLEVRPNLLLWDCDEVSGKRLDIRIAWKAHKDAPVSIGWAESFNFEPWKQLEASD